METRMRYNFMGCVQGVGFRYRAYHTANLFGLTGWVRNDYDGSVTMEIQGDRSSIESLLEKLGQGRYIDIDRIDSKELPVEPSERSFEIRD